VRVPGRPQMRGQEEFLSDLRRHQLHSAKDGTLHLAATIGEAAKIASRSSQRVKELDHIKLRVQATLELVEGIRSQQSSLEGVPSAMAAKEYERAVGYLTRYFATEEQLRGIGEIADLTSDAATAQAVTERDRLREAIQTEFREAGRKNDADAVDRFSKLFRPLGIAEEGLGLYVRHLRGVMAADLAPYVKSNVVKVETKDGDGTYVAILSHVLDSVAAAVEAHQAHVSTHFGPAHAREFLRQINDQASAHMVPVLQSLVKITRPVIDAPESVEPPEMDRMMDEIAQLSRTCHIYYTFLAQCHATEAEAEDRETQGAESPPAPGPDHAAAPPPAHRPLPAFVTACEAYELLQGVIALYIPLQREFFRLAFAKAAALDSGKQKKEAKEPASPLLPIRMLATDREEDPGPSAQGQGTSLVEDVFFMLRVSLHRVVPCRNPHVISAVVNTVVDVLRDALLPEIQRNVKISREQSRPSNRSMQWLNNLQLSIRYATKLHDEFASLLQRHRSAFEASEVPRVMEVASELKLAAEASAHHLHAFLRRVVDIVETQLHARGLAEFEQTDYRLTAAQYTTYEINDPWVLTALQAWDAVLEPYRKGLNEPNFEELIKEVLNFVVHQVEAVALQKAFTQYGALQLDKDVRALRNFFTERTDKPVRDKFTRLAHITALLSVDKVSEVYDLWGAPGTTGAAGNPLAWRLSSAEVKTILALRVDFEKTAIAALRLK